MAYSEQQLSNLAKTNPKELVRFLTSPNADANTLTFGAELLGEVKDEKLVLPIFRRLLRHVNALVREGAMLGVSALYLDEKPAEDIVERLVAISKSDPSPECRACAETMLEGYLE